VGIQCRQPFPKVEAIIWDIGVCGLRLSVNSSIRAARAMHGDALLTKGKECLFQIILHGVSTDLALPSIQGGSVIGDLQL
jgi:hypothetical protein